MPHRDFDAARAERVRETEPVSFMLGGQRFSCVVEPALADVMALVDAPEPTDSEVRACAAILAFTAELVVPEDRARFRRLVARNRPRRFRRRAREIAAPDVVELGQWLAEVYSGRPTRPSGDLSSGRQPNGGRSSGSSSDGAAVLSPVSG